MVLGSLLNDLQKYFTDEDSAKKQPTDDFELSQGQQYLQFRDQTRSSLEPKLPRLISLRTKIENHIST